MYCKITLATLFLGSLYAVSAQNSNAATSLAQPNTDNNGPTIWKVAGNGIDCLYYRLPNIKLAIRRDAQTRQVAVSTSTECAKACNAEQGCQSFEYNWQRQCKINAGDLFTPGVQPDWSAEEGSDFYQLRDCVSATADASGGGNEHIIVRTTNANTPSASVLLQIIGAQAGSEQQNSNNINQSQDQSQQIGNNLPKTREVADLGQQQDFNQQNNEKPLVSISRPSGGPLRVEVQRRSPKNGQKLSQLQSRVLPPQNLNNADFDQNSQQSSQLDDGQSQANLRNEEQQVDANQQQQANNHNFGNNGQSEAQFEAYSNQFAEETQQHQRPVAYNKRRQHLPTVLNAPPNGQYAYDVDYSTNGRPMTAQVSTGDFSQANIDPEIPSPSRFSLQKIPQQQAKSFQNAQRQSELSQRNILQQNVDNNAADFQQANRNNDDYEQQQQQFSAQPRPRLSSFRDQDVSNDDLNSQQQQPLQRSNSVPLRRRAASTTAARDFSARAVQNQAADAANHQQQQPATGISNNLAFVLTRSAQNNLPVVADINAVSGNSGTSIAHTRLDEGTLGTPLIRTRAQSGRKGTSDARSLGFSGFGGKNRIESHAEAGEQGLSNAVSRSHTSIAGGSDTLSNATSGLRGISNANAYSFSDVGGSSNARAQSVAGDGGVANSYAHTVTGLGGINGLQSSATSGEGGVSIASGYGGRAKFNIDATLSAIRRVGNGQLTGAADDAGDNAQQLGQEQFDSQPNVPAQVKISK